MTQPYPPDDWRPEWFQDPITEDPLSDDPVVVAEIAPTTNVYEHSRQLFTALVPPEKLKAVLSQPGGIGYDVSASGPHPSNHRGNWEYTPRFWVWAGEVVPMGLEPLVVSWKMANHFVLWPDQGFLMTYGLVPRLVPTEGDIPELHWDDLSAPRRDIVVSKVTSTYRSPQVSGARVTVARKYLQDYATIRKQALVQVYLAQQSGSLTPDIVRVLGKGHHIKKFHWPGRFLDIHISEFDSHHERPALVRVWGVRPLLKPDDAPVSAGRGDYGSLMWPGIPEPVTQDTARQYQYTDHVYVSDSVLGQYEGRSEYSIDPESGSVSYGNQWSVSYTQRIGRDLIAVELKKLYESNPPEIVQHWHAHAQEPPSDPLAPQGRLNVGSRTRRIVYALAGLGEALEALASPILNQPMKGEDFVGLDRTCLDYAGWWTAEHVEPVTRHIPLTLTREDSLRRCQKLHQLVVESLKEGIIRRTLVALGIPPNDIREYRSLKLLDLLIRLAEEADQAGLQLSSDGSELYGRLQTASNPSNPLKLLFKLNDLRQMDTHAISSNNGRFSSALRAFSLNPASFAAGWGTALDEIYDRISETLESITSTLNRTTGATAH